MLQCLLVLNYETDEQYDVGERELTFTRVSCRCSTRTPSKRHMQWYGLPAGIRAASFSPESDTTLSRAVDVIRPDQLEKL